MRQRLAILLLASTAVMSFAAAQASASGSWHGVSGTVYSDGTWFTSGNVRTVRATDGAIKVQFNTIPTGNLAWYVKSLNTNAKIGSTVYIPSVKPQLLGHARPRNDVCQRIQSAAHAVLALQWLGVQLRR